LRVFINPQIKIANKVQIEKTTTLDCFDNSLKKSTKPLLPDTYRKIEPGNQEKSNNYHVLQNGQIKFANDSDFCVSAGDGDVIGHENIPSPSDRSFTTCRRHLLNSRIAGVKSPVFAFVFVFGFFSIKFVRLFLCFIHVRIKERGKR
jgi:hypothetical protein